MKKLIGLLITFIALNGCANSLAFLGPASTSVTGGKHCSISSFICSKLWSKKTNWKISISTCIGLCTKTQSRK